MSGFVEESVSGESFAEDDSDAEVNKNRKKCKFIDGTNSPVSFVVYLVDV